MNKQSIYTIDINKCEQYNLKYDKLPARYNYNGFYSTTGRIYCSSDYWTPIQNIPKNKRDILYAEKGCVFIELDYKSFEFDILCQIMGYKVYDDPHTKTYNDLVNIPHPDFRNIGKNINYSLVYGMNEQRLMDTVITKLIDIPKDFKTIFMKKIEENEMINKVKELELILKNKIINNNTIYNFFGRNIHFKKDFAVLHNYISSTASDLLYNKIVNIIDLLKDKNKIILQNHDSILLQLKEDDIKNSNLFENILNIMQSPVNGLKGRVNYTWGYDWGNLV